MLNVIALQKVVPKSQRSLITQDFIDTINNVSTDEVIAEAFKDNFISYISVLSEGKYKMQDYLNAVKYITYKLNGASNIDAYAKTFPDRYEKAITNGVQIDANVSMYNSNKLVNKIYEQTVIPTYILNAPIFQEAINELTHIALHDTNLKGMAKVKALDVLLTHLKPPEPTKLNIGINIGNTESMNDLIDQINNLAQVQREALQNGVPLKTIAESNIINVKPEATDG